MITRIAFDDISQQEKVIRAIIEAIHPLADGYCIVNNKAVDEDAFMRMLQGKVGTSFTVSTTKEGKQIPYDIVKDRGTRSFSAGNILSASNLFFPMHTDSTMMHRPADVVLLYCVENAENGGDSTMLNINKVLHLLPEDYIQYLLTERFRIACGAYPVLEYAGSVYMIRYYLNELLLNYSETEIPAIKTALQPLITLLSDERNFIITKLQKDECLVINNRTCLHGRTAFEDNSSRLFYRARHYMG